MACNFSEFDDMLGASAHEVKQDRATAETLSRLEKLNQRFDEFFGDYIPAPAIRPTGRRLSSGRDYYVPEEPTDPLAKFMDEADPRPAQEALHVTKKVLPPAPAGKVWARNEVGQPWRLMTTQSFVKACFDYSAQKVR